MGQPSSVHRGDFARARRSVTIAMLELEALEPRIQLGYKRGEWPAEAAADVSLARLMVVELDNLLRSALDIAIADRSDIYADATYDVRQLAGGEK